MTKMTVKLIQFGNYQFENVVSATASMSDLKSSVSDIPDADGAYDDQVGAVGKQDRGTVEAEFHLEATSPAEMQTKKDTLRACIGYTPRALWWLPDGENTARYCRARLTSFDMPEDSERSDSLQTVNMKWMISMPRWYSRPLTGYISGTIYPTVNTVSQNPYYLDFDGSFDLGQSLSIPRVYRYVTDGLVLSLTNNGNAPTPLFVRLMGSRPYIETGDGAIVVGVDPGAYTGAYGSLTLTNPTLTRYDPLNTPVEQFTYVGTLSQNEVLEVDTNGGTVYKDSWPTGRAAAFAQFSDTLGLGFLTLDPGVNTLKINGTFSGPFGFLMLDWADAWY